LQKVKPCIPCLVRPADEPSGYTLTELVIVLRILAVVLGLSGIWLVIKELRHFQHAPRFSSLQIQLGVPRATREVRLPSRPVPMARGHQGAALLITNGCHDRTHAGSGGAGGVSCERQRLGEGK